MQFLFEIELPTFDKTANSLYDHAAMNIIILDRILLTHRRLLVIIRGPIYILLK